MNSEHVHVRSWQAAVEPVLDLEQGTSAPAAEDTSNRFAALTIKPGREVSIDAENVPPKGDMKTPTFGYAIRVPVLWWLICLGFVCGKRKLPFLRGCLVLSGSSTWQVLGCEDCRACIPFGQVGRR